MESSQKLYVDQHRKKKLSDEDGVEATACVGYRRSTQGMEFMVDFRFRPGECRSFPYSQLDEMAYNAERTSITLRLHKVLVTLHGLRLQKLYDRLRQHRVTWVQEAEGGYEFEQPVGDDPLVERIVIETLGQAE